MIEYESVSKYLEAFLPDPTGIQKDLFLHWTRLRLAELELPETDDGASLVFQKSLNCFFPDRFFLTFPFELPDMQVAASVIKAALQKTEKPRIVFYGDRDADGVTSTAICYLFFKNVLNYPDDLLHLLLPGEEDKYGVTEEVAEKIISEKPDILIVLDSGSSNKDSFELINKRIPEIQVLVLDHHFLPEKPEDFPAVDAFVNPMRLDKNHAKRHLCTAGLAFNFIYAIVYSHTSDFEKIYKIVTKDGDQFIKNGVVLVEKPAKNDITIIANETETAERVSEDDTFYLDDLWKAEVKNDPDLAKVVRFLVSCKDDLEPVQKFHILKNLAMKKAANVTVPFLTLAAVGTVADSVSLVDDNRILVREGLRVIQNNTEQIPVGLKQLLQVLKIAPWMISEKDIGFGIGPAINAAGRMGNAKLSLDVLIESDPLQATKLSTSLKDENEKRKELSQLAISVLEEQIDENNTAPILALYDSRVHRGISGLVAGKFAEKYNRPTLILVDDGDCLRGSIRAAKGENVIQIIHKMDHWFIQSGGHEAAAGFSLAHDKKDAFLEEVLKEGARILAEQDLTKGENLPEDTCIIDIKDSDIRTSLWNDIKTFAPFGQSNPYPLLLLEITQPPKYSFMGKEKNHLKLNFPAISTSLVEGVWFFGAENKDFFDQYDKYLFAAEPNINYFFGKTKYQLRFVQSIIKQTV
ncbi:MAG: DHH family phosphoesterase [Leptospirales bacterium]